MINKRGGKIKTKLLLLSCLVSGLLAVYLALSSYAKVSQLQNNISANALTSTEDQTATLKYSYITNDKGAKPNISALAYTVGDLDTGEIILQKNESRKLPIASVSKLMTALVLKNNEIAFGSPNDIIQVSKQAVATEGENGGLRINEKIKVGDIFYPLLLESSNDAAEAIALKKDRVAFLDQMNSTAKNLGLENTSYADPSGLSPENQSTTNDLFKLSKYIKENSSDLLHITTKQSFKNEHHIWYSNNQFVKETGYLGGKSGFTDEALQTGVSLFSVPLSLNSAPRNIGITILHSSDRHKDVESILKYLKTNVSYGPQVAEKIQDKNVADLLQKQEKKIPPPVTLSPPPAPLIPPPPEPDFITMTFGGDIMLDRGVRSSVLKNFAGDYSKLFEKTDVSKLLQDADIVFANLEGVASDKGADIHNLYSFRMNPSIVPALKGGGIDILSVANNHVGDWGIDAYTDTLARLKENEILYAGGGANEREAEQPTIIEKNGMKIGFLAFSDKGPDWMKATENTAGPLMANNPRFDVIIKNAKAKVDFLIVSFHFGEEYQTAHNERQATLAHEAIDDGAKIIIGAHPHVVEDTEVYKNGYIAYSLGNFVFDQPFSANTMQGMLLTLKLNKDGSLSVAKNILKLNSVFQPNSIVPGKEENIKFQ